MALSCTDFPSAFFSDERLRSRFRLLLADLDAHPGCPLPQACRSPAALKGAYRFLAHPDSSVDNLLPAFVRPSIRRAMRRTVVLAVHDSASFNYSTLEKTKGLGFINDSPTAKGLHLHSSLLLDEDCHLIGLAHLHFWTRPAFRVESAQEVKDLPIERKESCKWLIGIRATADAFAGQAGKPPRLIHVMDREGDIHEVFAEVRRRGHGAVIRCAQDRRVEGDEPDQTERAKRRVEVTRPLGTIPLRVPLKGGGYRIARVEVRTSEVRLRPNEKKHGKRRPLKLWLVEAREVSTPPAGEKAAKWWLWTTLAVHELERVQRVLSIYRARWRIEEYHRMMKTGCGVEKLRLDSADKLMKVITMQAWVATRVVQIRDEVRRDPLQNCEACFRPAEWKLLWTRQHRRGWQEGDGIPSLGEVVKWLGRLGGHQGRKGDGMPGAELMSRGLYALDLLLEGQHLARLDQASAAEEPSPPHLPSHQDPRG
jgi:hypothetical protein